MPLNRYILKSVRKGTISLFIFTSPFPLGAARGYSGTSGIHLTCYPSILLWNRPLVHEHVHGPVHGEKACVRVLICPQIDLNLPAGSTGRARRGSNQAGLLSVAGLSVSLVFFPPTVRVT